MSVIISDEDVKSVVSSALGSSFKIVDYKLEPFAKEKNGMLGTYQLLTVKVLEGRGNASDNDMKTQTFFIKALPTFIATKDRETDESLFSEEVLFYAKIRSLMIDNLKIGRWSAECYVAKPTHLIFEDLRAQGFVVRRNLLLEEKYLRSVLATLGRFHASSFLAEKRMGKTFKELFPNSFVEKFYTSEETGTFARIGYDAIASIADKIGLDSSVVPKIYDKVCKDVQPREDRFNVVCHGDLWRNNILFDESEPPNSLLVDFQIIKYTSPVIDVGMFIHIHTTRDTRKKLELDLFKHYYSIFRDTILANDCDIEFPSYETLLRDYQNCRIIAISYAALYSPLIAMKHETQQKLMNDQDLWQKFIYKERINFIESNMKEDAVYEKRIKDVITELLEEGQRIFQK